MDDRDALRLLLLSDDGEQIIYQVDEDPHPATRRLMDALGVRIEVASVKATSAHEAAATRDCTQPLCVNEALPGTDRCRPHTRAAELRANGTIERPPAFNGRLAWTKASIVAAMQRWAQEHDGQAPSSSAKGPNSWVKAGGWWPNVHTVVYHFGSWREGIVAAGLVPLGDSTAPKGSVRVPKAPEARASAPPEALDASPSEPQVTQESPEAAVAAAEPGTRTDELTAEQLAQIHADAALVDAHLASTEGAEHEAALSEPEPRVPGGGDSPGSINESLRAADDPEESARVGNSGSLNTDWLSRIFVDRGALEAEADRYNDLALEAGQKRDAILAFLTMTEGL